MSERFFRSIAAETRIPPTGITRIVTGVRVKYLKIDNEPEPASSLATMLTLGFSLNKGQVSMISCRREAVVALREAIIEFRNLCPLVGQWMQRGDFNPKKIPERLQRKELLHACRTSGRLRAAVLRSLD